MPRTAKHLVKHRYKPGESGNPKGRPKNPIPDALKKMTKQSYRRIIRIAVKGNVDALGEIIENEKSSVLEVAVAKCLVVAIQKGDYGTIEQIVQRIVGKIPDELNVNSKNITLTGKLDESKVKAVVEDLEKEV